MKIVFVALFGLLSGACAVVPAQPIAVADPANAQVAVPPVRHRSAIQTYLSQRPVDPAPWGERNEQVAPRPKQ